MQKSWFTLEKIKTSQLPYEQFISSLSYKMEKYGEWTPFLDKTKYDTIMNINPDPATQSITNTQTTYHPIITFHATSTQDVANSILKYGYVLPGEILLTTGQSVQMRIGKL